MLSMLEDLVDLFEQSAASGTPVREIVGDDPVEFADAFLRNYPQGQWIDAGAGPAGRHHQERRRRRHRQRRDIPMTTQQAQAIRVRGLEKSYKELRVLRGVDFDVARGSIFALLGSNGAGKTTVVKILSTLLKPDAGTVDRRWLRRRHASRRTCGSPSASPGSSRRWTKPSPGERTWCWWPGCGT